jgi:hypothetical protein
MEASKMVSGAVTFLPAEMYAIRYINPSIFFVYSLFPEVHYGVGKMDLREIGWVGMDWFDLAQYRDQWRALVNTVMNLRVP